VGGLAVLTALLWAAGGLKTRPHGPAEVEPGAAVDQGRFTVKVQDARLARVRLVFGTRQVNALVVRMHVASNDKRTASLNTELQTGIAGEPRPGTYVQPAEVNGLAHGFKTASVQPGLPVEAEAIWELGPGSAPRQITVVLRQWDYARGFTDLTERWTVTKESRIVAKVTLPVGAQ
jgi:hypothetical protein